MSKVAHHLIKERVDSGKKTAAQVKGTAEKTATSAKKLIPPLLLLRVTKE
ncbi:hypothetical protein [Trichormus azollae]|nr:hypothetical protein [Trichormus azollae]